MPCRMRFMQGFSPFLALLFGISVAAYHYARTLGNSGVPSSSRVEFELLPYTPPERRGLKLEQCSAKASL